MLVSSAYLSASKGTDMASKWHDPIGIAESVGTLILLLLLVLLLKKGFSVKTSPGFSEDSHGSFALLHQPCHRPFAWFTISWLVLTLLTTNFYYWYHERNLPLTRSCPSRSPQPDSNIRKTSYIRRNPCSTPLQRSGFSTLEIDAKPRFPRLLLPLGTR